MAVSLVKELYDVRELHADGSYRWYYGVTRCEADAFVWLCEHGGSPWAYEVQPHNGYRER